MNKVTFNELGLSAELLQAVNDLGFLVATTIQSEAIPVMLSGKDIVGQALTGTGKTAAFGLPMLEKIKAEQKYVQTLVMCPTRELCLQVAIEIRKLATHKKGVKVVAIFGGDSYDRQIKGLREGSQIVVGTPGRIIDHMDRGTLQLNQIQTLILDEADEMLNMGFRDDMEKILSKTPAQRQTALFSATMSPEILAIAQKFMDRPQLIKVTQGEVTNRSVTQQFMEVVPSAKVEVLSRIIDVHQLGLVLVFCNQKKTVDELAERLRERGYPAEALHGDLPQAARNIVMSRFRSGSINLLIATDVAARGLDVDDIDAVVNYDIPYDPEVYVHRIGRTGRAGKSGKAYSLVAGPEKRRLEEISRYTKAEIVREPVPAFQQVITMRGERFVDKVVQTVQEKEWQSFSPFVSKLFATGLPTEQIIAALVKMNFGEIKNEFQKDNIETFSLERAKNKSRREFRTDTKSEQDYFKKNKKGVNKFQDRTDKKSGKPFASGKDKNMTSIILSIGKKDKITPAHIVGAIAGESGLPASILGRIDINDKVTSVAVPNAHLEAIVRSLEGVKIKGKKVTLRLDKD